WTMHNACRYVFVAAEGPVVLFDLPSSMHLSPGLETIDERRPSLAWDFMAVGSRGPEMAGRWAAEIADLLRRHAGPSARLAMARADRPPLEGLAHEGVTAVDGKPVIERARAVKSPEEVRAFVASLRSTEAAIGELRAALKPGMTEQEALAILIAGSLRRGGE